MLVLVGAAITKDTPLQAIQLLWVNLIMDSLAALALATEMPTVELLHRPPINRTDYIVSRKMIKHILGKGFWMCTCLFVCMFAGEHFIVEPDPQWRYGRDSQYVFPGRMYTRSGQPLYIVHEKDGASRHMTFIFTMFVVMQIINMFPARKIRDEFNIFVGLHKNIMFILIFLFIAGMQVLITQVGSVVMKVHPSGLAGAQWGEAIAIGATILVIDVILKFLPDDWFPKLGQDSVDDRRLALKKGNADKD